MGFSYRVEQKLKELWLYDKRKERNDLLLSLVSERIPNIKEILQEMQKELAEKVKNHILELEL